MNLLLLLSALLSALTGVGAVVRQPAVAQVASARAVRAAPAVARKIASRPAAEPATRVRRAASRRDVAFALVPAEPLFAARRRE